MARPDPKQDNANRRAARLRAFAAGLCSECCSRPLSPDGGRRCTECRDRLRAVHRTRNKTGRYRCVGGCRLLLPPGLRICPRCSARKREEVGGHRSEPVTQDEWSEVLG